MNKKELTETFKIIYDALSEETDSAEEIKQLNDKLNNHDFLIRCLVYAMITNVKSSQFSLNTEITPYDLTKYIKDILQFNPYKQNIDDKFIDETIELLKQQ